MPEYIVVGSGCAGAMAAQTLVEAGKHVLMVDVGIGSDYSGLIPDKDYLDIRKTEPQQYQYLIGKDAEGLAWGKVGKGEQITPPRKYMLQDVDKYLPIDSKSFSPVESLAYGGLGVGWGIGCWEFSQAETEAAGLNHHDMQTAYNVVAQRVGISAQKDTAAAYTLGGLKGYQPAARMDRNHTLLYQRYLTRQNSLARKGLVMGRAPLALLTRDMPGRKKYAYREMEFYSDTGKSAWRPWMTIDALRKKRTFTYRGGLLALSFKEKKAYTELTCLDTQTGKHQVLRCKKLVLASSALGTARIVLRSQPQGDGRLPLLCNPYSYAPCLQPALLGRAAEPHKMGFAQLSFFLDENHAQLDTAMASIYGYQSLMLFRIVKQVPLNFSDARSIMRYLMSSIVIMGIHQSDRPSAHKFVTLAPDTQSPTGDKLRATYELSATETAARARREKKYLRAMRSLGAYPLKRVDPGFGSSIHYAGTLPFSKTAQPHTLDARGKLHGTHTVYVADSAGFTYLPAKGLTFSLLANAHLTAKGAIDEG